MVPGKPRQNWLEWDPRKRLLGSEQGGGNVENSFGCLTKTWSTAPQRVGRAYKQGQKGKECGTEGKAERKERDVNSLLQNSGEEVGSQACRKLESSGPGCGSRRGSALLWEVL